MSVMSISKQELADVFCTLERKRDSINYIFEEDLDKIVDESERDEFQSNRIKFFCERIFIANQIAICYNYNQELKADRLPFEELEKGSMLGNKKMFSVLGHFDYNVYTNAGRCFLGKEDEEKIERLRMYFASRCLDD